MRRISNRHGRILTRARASSATAMVFALALATAAGAQDLDVPIYEHGSDGQMASCSTSIVSGLDPAGDGFLAVRAGPGSGYDKIGEVYNGDIVTVYEISGDWAGVMYGEDGGACDFIGLDQRREVTYPGTKGWVHTNWLTHHAG